MSVTKCALLLKVASNVKRVWFVTRVMSTNKAKLHLEKKTTKNPVNSNLIKKDVKKLENLVQTIRQLPKNWRPGLQ